MQKGRRRRGVQETDGRRRQAGLVGEHPEPRASHGDPADVRVRARRRPPPLVVAGVEHEHGARGTAWRQHHKVAVRCALEPAPALGRRKLHVHVGWHPRHLGPRPAAAAAAAAAGGLLVDDDLRADPAYQSYYYSNAHLNPRLPPPLLSKEDWRSSHHRLRSAGFGGIGDGRRQQPQQAPAEGTVGLPGIDLARQRSFSTVFQVERSNLFSPCFPFYLFIVRYLCLLVLVLYIYLLSVLIYVFSEKAFDLVLVACDAPIFD